MPPRVAAAASARMRCLYSTLWVRRFGFVTTSGSGREASTGSAPALAAVALRLAALASAPIRASQSPGGQNPKRIPAHLSLFFLALLIN
jgi:hypothetical protein